MIRIRWPDGQEDRVHTWREVFEHVRRDQWTPETPYSLRRQLAERARVWSGAKIDSKLPLPEFMRALADAGMFVIEDDSEEGGAV
jgi:hypothetical protein